MKLSSVLLFLQLWVNVEVSLSQNACSTLPNVAHAHVSEETKKAVYQEGDVIHFSCESGYISDQISKFVCAASGWLVVRQGKCYSCSTLPDVPNARVTEETRKAEYREGDVINFACQSGYASDLTIKYVCASEGWQALRQGACYLVGSSCDPPPPAEGLTVKGLLGNNNPILPDHILTFSCDGPGNYLNGVSVLICGQDGQWNNPFPTCRDGTCKVGVMHPNLYVAGLPPSNEVMTAGHQLRFLCSDKYVVDGSTEIECLENGQWNSPFPTCSANADNCSPPLKVENAVVTTPYQKEYPSGSKVTYQCFDKYTVEGEATITCTAGEWEELNIKCIRIRALGCLRPPRILDGQMKGSGKSQYRHNEKVEYVCDSGYIMEGGPFKTCIDGEWTGEMRCRLPQGCGRPPLLSDGDTTTTPKHQYRHNERVKYICQNYYVMEGGPFKTCFNAEWTGNITCLRPCTVDREQMDKHNIQFRYKADDKLYSQHNEEIEFVCTKGRRFGTLGMRQRCKHGVMQLPTCQ